MKKIVLFLSVNFLFMQICAQENCGNGVDDDGNLLIDCLDSSCTSNSVPTGALFNTATNGSGGVLPGGSNDNNWQVSVGALAGPYVPAIVMSSIPGSYYSSPWPDCGWISHNAFGTHSFDEDFYYKMEFYLPCYTTCGVSYADSAVFCLTMDFFSDNSVDEVYVNGIPQSASLAGVPAFDPYYNVGFSAAGGLSFSLCSDWQPGLNTLVIKVSSGPGYEGFLAQNSTSAPPATNDPTILSPFTNYAVCDSAAPVNFAAASPGGNWSATCGSCINSSTGVFDPSVAGPGTYTVTYSLAVPCPASDTSVIQVLALPPDAAINPEPARCVNDPAFNLTATASGGTWSGTGITNTATGTFDPAVSGTGTFTVTYVASGACGDTAIQTVTINPLPSPNFTSNVIIGCKPLCVQFNELTGTSCMSLVYYFGDGDSSLTSSPLHCYTDDSVYSVAIQCTDVNGCVGTTLIPNMITVFDYPVASFIISPSAIVNPNTLVNFTNTSTGGTNYSWMFGDPASGMDNISFSASPDHSYENEGEYCIVLVATNSGNCIDSIQYCMIVEGEATIFIPNVFTPNGDQSNDVFLVSSSRIKEISYIIYDRWGLKMAEYNGLTGGWNGETKNGSLAPDGTYYFILKAVTNKGNTIEKEGYLQLLSK